MESDGRPQRIFFLRGSSLLLILIIVSQESIWAQGQLLGSVKSFEKELDAKESQTGTRPSVPATNTGTPATTPSNPTPLPVESAGGAVEVKSGPEVCWSSSAKGGYASTSNPQVGAVTFYSNSGCSRCRIGEMCHANLVVQAPAHWAHNASVRLWEMIATLTGPSLVLARVQHLPPMDGSSFLISYQPWDAGQYRLVVLSSCGMLNFRNNFTIGAEEELASWDVQVVPSEPALNLPNPNPEMAALKPGVDYRPCLSNGLQARWVRSADGTYIWQSFPCSPTFPPSQWIAELNKRGIKEINFIGDSHHKRTGLHLYYLMTGQVDEPGQWYQVGDKIVANDSRGGILKINIYFIHGVYASNDQYNCSMRFRKTPEPDIEPISETADIQVLEAGYWTSYACQHPELSFARHFPDYLWWLQKTTEATQKKTNLGAHGRKSKIVCRAAPPVPTLKYGCKLHSNVVLQNGNALMRDLCPVAEGAFFDSWEVEAPRHHETCPRDHHYTCLSHKEPLVSGPIGEAVTTSLVHFLLRTMKPL